MALPCNKRSSRLAGLAGMVSIFFLLLLLRHTSSREIASPHRLKEAADTVDQCQIPSGGFGSTEPRIPNIVHQIWNDDDLSTYPLTASRETWEWLFGSNYTIKLWTEADRLNLVKTSYPWFLSTYTNYDYDIQRADVARLMVVHHEGGIYADLDAYPVDNASSEAIPCLQNMGYQVILSPTRDDRGISNHFFMAEKDSEFLLWALQEAKRRATALSSKFMLPYLAVFWSTGPLMITAVMNEYAWLYNQAEEVKAMAVLRDNYSRSIVHHAAGRSWHGSDGRALNFIADHFQDALVPVVFIFALTAIVVMIVRHWARVRPRLRNAIRLSQL